MEYRLGQKVRYKRVVRKITRYIDSKEFREKEIVAIDKIKMVEFKKIKFGFIMGTRQIGKVAEYTFEDDDPDVLGTIVHHRTEIIEVYKVAYDMAHTNYVLEEDLEEVK